MHPSKETTHVLQPSEANSSSPTTASRDSPRVGENRAPEKIVSTKKDLAEYEKQESRAVAVTLLAIFPTVLALATWKESHQLKSGIEILGSIFVGMAFMEIWPGAISRGGSTRALGSLQRAMQERAKKFALFVAGTSGIATFILALVGIAVWSFHSNESATDIVAKWSLWGLVWGGIVGGAYWAATLALTDAKLIKRGGWKAVESDWREGKDPFESSRL